MTRRLGVLLGENLFRGAAICLSGDLGAGKTLLTRGIMEGLRGDSSGVRSPSFTLINHYPGPTEVFHVDLYRLSDQEEVGGLGLEELFEASGVVVVEWAEKLGEMAPVESLKVQLQVTGPLEREISWETRGEVYEALLTRVRRAWIPSRAEEKGS
jgi:tRNA threonylcarbamoyladenosine biosynthesis protein TsaE